MSWLDHFPKCSLKDRLPEPLCNKELILGPRYVVEPGDGHGHHSLSLRPRLGCYPAWQLTVSQQGADPVCRLWQGFPGTVRNPFWQRKTPGCSQWPWWLTRMNPEVAGGLGLRSSQVQKHVMEGPEGDWVAPKTNLLKSNGVRTLSSLERGAALSSPEWCKLVRRHGNSCSCGTAEQLSKGLETRRLVVNCDRLKRHRGWETSVCQQKEAGIRDTDPAS